MALPTRAGSARAGVGIAEVTWYPGDMIRPFVMFAVLLLAAACEDSPEVCAAAERELFEPCTADAQCRLGLCHKGFCGEPCHVVDEAIGDECVNFGGGATCVAATAPETFVCEYYCLDDTSCPRSMLCDTEAANGPDASYRCYMPDECGG